MGSIIATFLGIQSQFKVFHWQTQSYAKHMAYGGIYDALDPLIDTFLETYMGKYGRVALEGEKDAILLGNIGEINIDEFLDTITDFLLSFNNQLNAQRDTDLLNLRDEMVAEINKLKYLLTLK
ncbi:hypothetical protein UFOVP699_285 [uncultured Caudovirales phage]|uniref:Uncharacterized protein n=1 Tax=uncultured Caudovirales phage TaxID=2100421 RepID=A0A6J5NJL2_9CAUD|nr:hypothetical protein UFOVP699_285 [uncultured Caudovirales phage]